MSRDIVFNRPGQTVSNGSLSDPYPVPSLQIYDFSHSRIDSTSELVIDMPIDSLILAGCDIAGIIRNNTRHLTRVYVGNTTLLADSMRFVGPIQRIDFDEETYASPDSPLPNDVKEWIASKRDNQREAQ